MTKRYKEIMRKDAKEVSVEELVYLNACECLYYGYKYDALNKLILNEQDAKKIWIDALHDMARDV